jgi:hypothetical protein
MQEAGVFDRVRKAALPALLAFGLASNAFGQAVVANKNEIGTDFTFSSSTFTGVDSNRTAEYRWSVSYGRFLTERFAVGPVFAIRNDVHGDQTPMNVGGLARFYFNDRDAGAIPFVEAAGTRSFHYQFDMDHTDLQVSGGLVFPMGDTGGRFRVAPYYYRAFYDADLVGHSYVHSFGVSWSVALLF